uniref:Uncharacterized protein n=1 Tax=Arundo donax TaxID=35708 RepID=A0A0A9I196_ARUDO
MQKRCSTKLHHLQLRCWMDLMFASLHMGRPALVKHLQWKQLKVLKNYRTLEEPFRIIKEREGLFQYQITVSVLEVYS